MPARRYIVSPQGGGPLALRGQTLGVAQQGIAYAATVFPYASAGTSPYTPFTLIAQLGPNAYAVSALGVVSGTPLVSSVWVDADGAYVVDEQGNPVTDL
jgi:hypothetical protein